VVSVPILLLHQRLAQPHLLPLLSVRRVQREVEDYSEILPIRSLLVLDFRSVEVSPNYLVTVAKAGCDLKFLLHRWRKFSFRIKHE